MPDFETIILTLGSLLAGFVNAIAGGGGLVTLPVMLSVFPQAEPAVLFGTNKASMICGTASAAVDYARHVTLPWRTLGPAVVVALLGGAVGAWLVTLVSPDGLRRALPFMLATVFLVTLFGGHVGERHAPRFGPRAEAGIAAGIALVMGLYDGFFGPGTGSFLIFFMVRLLGFDYLHAAACTKVINMTTNLGALVFLGTAGHVWWKFFLPMAVANVVGAYTQLIIAGLAGFIVGQTINAWTVVKIKERTREKHLWARLVGSTFAGQLGDTLVFCAIAAGAIGITTFRDFATYAALGWIYKTAVEVVLLPVTYRVIAYIKRHEPTHTALV
jgi:uncharacterized integral membrane protein (TIGR00697 family)